MIESFGNMAAGAVGKMGPWGAVIATIGAALVAYNAILAESRERTREYWNEAGEDAERSARRQSAAMRRESNDDLMRARNTPLRNEQETIAHIQRSKNVEATNRATDADYSRSAQDRGEWRQFRENAEERVHSHNEGVAKIQQLETQRGLIGKSRSTLEKGLPELEQRWDNTINSHQKAADEIKPVPEEERDTWWSRGKTMAASSFGPLGIIADLASSPSKKDGLTKVQREEKYGHLDAVDEATKNKSADVQGVKDSIATQKKQELDLIQQITAEYAKQGKNMKDLQQDAYNLVKVEKERFRNAMIGSGSRDFGDLHQEKRIQDKAKRIKAGQEKNIAAGRDKNQGLETFTQEEGRVLISSNNKYKGVFEEQSIATDQKFGIEHTNNEDTVKERERVKVKVDALTEPQAAAAGEGVQKGAGDIDKAAKQLGDAIEKAIDYESLVAKIKQNLEEKAAIRKSTLLNFQHWFQ